MVFIETSVFTKKYTQYLSDDEYCELQNFLINNPDAGVLIQETGGLRKLRWLSKNKGKRDGIRVIYYLQPTKSHIYLMTLYPKNEKADLTAQEKKLLKQMLIEWK